MERLTFVEFLDSIDVLENNGTNMQDVDISFLRVMSDVYWDGYVEHCEEYGIFQEDLEIF